MVLPSPPARALSALLITSFLLASIGCGGGPPRKLASGERLEVPQGGFSVVVPEGWEGRASRAALTVTRTLPYGGGYPAMNIRRVSGEELAAVDFDGTTVETPAGEVEYRYRRWRNARGQGYRLEALVRTPQATLFVDASVWDPAQSMDRRFFHEAFWPMLNSLKARAQAD